MSRSNSCAPARRRLPGADLVDRGRPPPSVDLVVFGDERSYQTGPVRPGPDRHRRHCRMRMALFTSAGSRRAVASERDGRRRHRPPGYCTNIQLLLHNAATSRRTPHGSTHQSPSNRTSAPEKALQARWPRSRSSSARARSTSGRGREDRGHPGRLHRLAGPGHRAGVGGLPRGRVVEIYGPESSGKTTLTLQVIAEMQKRAAPAPSSTPSTRSTPPTPRSSASTCRNC